MKKLSVVLVFALAFTMVLVGCASIESRAEALIRENLTSVQQGDISGLQSEEFLNVLTDNNISADSHELFKSAIETAARMMTFSINSTTVDPNDNRSYIVSVDITTVDVTAIFFDELFWEDAIGAIADTVAEQAAIGAIDTYGIQTEVFDMWVSFIAERLQAASATKTTTVEFVVTVHRNDSEIRARLPLVYILGIDADSFGERWDELVELLESSFVTLETFAADLTGRLTAMEFEFGLSTVATADGDTLVITMQAATEEWANMLADDPDNLIEIMVDLLAAQAPDFFDDMNEAVIVCNMIVFQYVDADGEVIVSREITE